MSMKTAASIGALTTLLITPGAYAMPMSGTMTGHVETQNAQPMGGPDKLKIEETASASNVSPGSPLDGAQVALSEVVLLNKGRGPVRGTNTFTTPTGTTSSTYKGMVTTDAQGRVTVKGKFTTTKGTGAFAGLKGGGTFTVAYTSKTDFISEWKGKFTPPKTARR